MHISVGGKDTNFEGILRLIAPCDAASERLRCWRCISWRSLSISQCLFWCENPDMNDGIQ